MSGNPNMNNDPEFSKIKTRDDHLKKLHYKTEKHDYENILKSLGTDCDFHKKKYKNLNKKKIIMIVSEFLIGISGLTVGSGFSISGLAPVGLVIVGSISFLSSTSTLITNEYFSN